MHGTRSAWRQLSGWHTPCSSGTDILQPPLLRGLVPWGVFEPRRRFLDDLGSEAHIHALFVGDTVLGVTPGATRRIKPRQALWLQHGRTIPHMERLIALQGSRQRGLGEVREKGG